MSLPSRFLLPDATDMCEIQTDQLVEVITRLEWDGLWPGVYNWLASETTCLHELNTQCAEMSVWSIFTVDGI